MKSQLIKISSAVVIFLASIFAAGCGSKAEPQKKNLTAVEDTISVMVSKAESNYLSSTKVYTGSLEGEQQANVVSQLAERIIEIPVQVGDHVKAGQILIKLEKSGVTSQYYQALSNLNNVEQNLTRMKTLYEGGAVSKQQLDATQTQYDIAKANFQASKNAVEITSPISGIVTSIKNNIGDFTSPGVPLITVAKISSLKAVMSIGEGDIPYAKQGQEVKVYSEVNPSNYITGKIIEIAKSADTQTRTFQVKAAFNNKDNFFSPGMFVNTELQLKTKNKVIIIPRESVLYSEKGPQVYTVSNGHAQVKEVKLGFQNDTDIEVIEGLQAGDTVVRVGMNNLKNGTPVMISNNNLLSSN